MVYKVVFLNRIIILAGVLMRRKSIINMNNMEAKSFFMKPSSYSNINLPEYFNFKEVLSNADDILSRSNLNSLLVSDKEKHYYNLERINYTLITNKDGKYSWRPLTLIHPLLYADLVNVITEENSWKEIISMFKKAKDISNIQCVSLPVESKSKKGDTGESILNWWENFEQLQIKLALEYKYCMHTDIADCYGSIYTHSIPWAIHSKENAKQERNKGIGNKIDQKIQRLQYNQTNGIPQGSILMDFIAEIVLAGVDIALSEIIKRHNNDVFILRFRDDYRIFANDRSIVEEVTRDLTEILLDWNFKLNSNKTYLSDDIIKHAVKEDKLYWTLIKSSFKKTTVAINNNEGKHNSDNHPYKVGLQKYLLQIKILAEKFPNSGSLKTALTELYKEVIYKLDKAPNDIHQLISIIVNIMERNPNVIEHCVTNLSKLLSLLSADENIKIINSIRDKFHALPNSEFSEIWLQRIALPYKGYIDFNSNLGKKVQNPNIINIWKSEWFAKSFDENSLIDKELIDSLDAIIDVEQIDLFNEYLS